MRESQVCGVSLSRQLTTAEYGLQYMATYFTRGVESTNELRISLSRLNAFLTLPEPPVPSHLKVTSLPVGLSRGPLRAERGTVCSKVAAMLWHPGARRRLKRQQGVCRHSCSSGSPHGATGKSGPSQKCPVLLRCPLTSRDREC